MTRSHQTRSSESSLREERRISEPEPPVKAVEAEIGEEEQLGLGFPDEALQLGSQDRPDICAGGTERQS